MNATDYRFAGLAETIPVRTTLTLVKESDVELHEQVAVPLPAGETRSVEELVQDRRRWKPGSQTSRPC